MVHDSFDTIRKVLVGDILGKTSAELKRYQRHKVNFKINQLNQLMFIKNGEGIGQAKLCLESEEELQQALVSEHSTHFGRDVMHSIMMKKYFRYDMTKQVKSFVSIYILFLLCFISLYRCLFYFYLIFVFVFYLFLNSVPLSL